MKKLLLLFAFTLSMVATLVAQEIEPAPPPPPISDEEQTFTMVEEMPRFPGCEEISDKQERSYCATEKMLRFTYRNLVYPQEARANGVEGTVVIKFYVDVDGSLQDIELLKDIGDGCGEAAMDVVRKMDEMEEKWIPGIQRGKNVKVYFNLPIRFRL